MRPRSWLKTLFALSVMATLVGGCVGTHGLASLPQPPSPLAQGTCRPAHVMLPAGVKRMTDPNLHPTGTYHPPEWDPRTTALVGWIVVGTYAVLIEAFQQVRLFP